MSGSPKKVYHHIDMMRFLFSLVIVHFHILNANILPFVTDPKYRELGQSAEFASNIVACFFIISGLFQYRSFRANPERSVFAYIMDRVVRLWPVLILAILLEAVLSGEGTWQRVLIDGMFLQCSGLSLEYKGILWYVSSYFFASVFLYAILRSCSGRKAGILISLLSYFGMVFLINYYQGKIGGRETLFYFLNVGMVRAVALVGAGILLAMVYEKLHEMVTLAPFSPVTEKVLFVAKLCVEIGAVVFLYDYVFHSPETENHIVLVLIFLLFLLSMISEKDPMGKVFNKKIFGFPGRYAYSIYVMQGTSFLILEKTLWRNEAFVSNVWLALIGSTLFSAALGIAVYYLVEKPCADAYRKWYGRYQTALAEKENEKTM